MIQETNSPQPLFSIIILNWNGLNLLHDCLESLQKQSFTNFEVILVDNGSTDESLSFVKTHFPEVITVPLSENYGFCGGNNRGVPYATGDYIIYLNNDTQADPHFLQNIYQAVTSAPPDVGSWAVRMMQWDERDKIDNCGTGFSAWGSGYQLLAGQKAAAVSPYPTFIFGSCGGACCFRKSVLDEIGLFDELFFFNNEDVDLSFRAQLAGYKCCFLPAAVVYHQGSATSGTESDLATYYIQRNIEYVFFKNLPFKLLLKYLLPHLLYSSGWVVYWILRGKGKVVLKAKLDAWRNRHLILEARQQTLTLFKGDVHYIDSLIDKNILKKLINSRALRKLFSA